MALFLTIIYRRNYNYKRKTALADLSESNYKIVYSSLDNKTIFTSFVKI